MDQRVINPLHSLSFPTAGEETLAPYPTNTFYAGRLRSDVEIGGPVVFDPDVVLEMDEEAYQKMVAELTIAAKLQKRTRRAVASGWQIHSEDTSLMEACSLLERLMGRIVGMQSSLYTLLFQANLTGFGCLRVFGDFRQTQLTGTWEPMRWWMPTNFIDVNKQRWRINIEDPLLVEQGNPRFFWAIQDIMSYNWHRLDMPEAPPGLRRCDYVWARPSEEEIDLGYAHGLGRGILHKWHMLTHSWMYAIDGAESWAKGKIVIKHPNTLGGVDLPGDSGISSLHRRAEEIRREIAREAARQLSRHVLVIDKEQEYEVFGRPESGHESVKWIVEKVEDELAEYILGISKNSQTSYDVDPDIVESDKVMIENAVTSDFLPNLVDWNADNFRALGWDPEQIKAEAKFVMRRTSGLDAEQLGKSIQIAMAAGAPIHRMDLYRGLGLTPVDPNSPDAIWAPQAGQPMGHGVVLRAPGSEVDGGSHDPVTGSSIPDPLGTGAPSPGGASIPQPGRQLHMPM